MAHADTKVRVIDGDTLVVDGVTVRIRGIDAPELRQTCRDNSGVIYLCGQAATKALKELVRGKGVSCTPRDRDRYGRSVAQCYVGDLDLGRAMVQAGWAIAYVRYSREYVPTQAEAQAARSDASNRHGRRQAGVRVPSLRALVAD